MPNTTINVGEYSPFTLTKDTRFFPLYRGQVERTFYQDMAGTSLPNGTVPSRVLDLTGRKKKILASTSRSFYHFIYDFVGKLSYQLDIDDNVEVIFDKNAMDAHALVGFPKVYNSVLTILDKRKIKYSLIDFNDYDYLKVDNFYSYVSFQVDVNYPKSAMDFYFPFVVNKDVKPFRKIFVSRSNRGTRGMMNIVPYINAQNDNRIDDFGQLDEYFKSLGFEIVFADDISSFEEQVRLFYEAEIIVGTSGSGLTNAIFMQEGTTVVELFTPLIISMPKAILTNTPMTPGVVFNQDDYFVAEEIHHYYNKIAFHKKQKYLAIPNQDRSVDKIKSLIETDPYMKYLMDRK